MRYLLLALCLCLTSTASVAEALSLRADCPKRYVVQPGDTLWSIATRYLHRPWEWKALWYANPKIRNPNRLYPGAVLILSFYHNKPYLRVLANGTVKLSPHVRPTLYGQPIPAIPLGDLKPFLDESVVLDHSQLNRAPYVVAFYGERMIGGQGDQVYVKNLHPEKCIPNGKVYSYAVYRKNGEYFNAATKEPLGYMASLIGYGELVKGGKPATLNITSITQGVKIGDRVLPNSYPALDLYFEPQAPEVKVCAHIIDMLPNHTTQAAMGQVVVLDQGRMQGLKPGDVLGLFSKARVVMDPELYGSPVDIPPERIGEAMIFRAFSQTSFALIVRSTRAIYLEDNVGNP